MSMPRHMIAVPRANAPLDCKHHTDWIEIDVRCFLHKEYPRCACGRKFIKECLYCKYNRVLQ